MSDNLRFYVQGKTVPDDAQRPFKRKGGFSGTDINSMWRIKCLTEIFGPVGFGWYTEITRRETVHYPESGETKVYVDISLYVRDPETGEWSKPITGTGGNDAILIRSYDKRVRDPETGRDSIESVTTCTANDEVWKMAETDALGSACKKLGIGADIYWSTDRTKYVLNDDGTVDAHVPTKEELRAENRARLAEMAKAEEEARKAAKAQKEADAKGAEVAAEEQIGEDKVGEKMAEHYGINIKTAKVALIRFHNSHVMDQEPNPILAKYVEDNGGTFMANWSVSTIIACYQEMVNRGFIQEGSQ